jgi:DNA-binding response OmpR family regulator
MARILVVDDYKDAAASAALFLGMGDDGDEVRIAHTVDEANAIADLFRPDLLITEANLTRYPPKPHACGFCLGEEIMERHHIKGIVLTTLCQPRYVEKARRRGFARHLCKPCDPEVLRAVIKEVLGESDSCREPGGRTVSN